MLARLLSVTGGKNFDANRYFDRENDEYLRSILPRYEKLEDGSSGDKLKFLADPFYFIPRIGGRMAELRRINEDGNTLPHGVFVGGSFTRYSQDSSMVLNLLSKERLTGPLIPSNAYGNLYLQEVDIFTEAIRMDYTFFKDTVRVRYVVAANLPRYLLEYLEENHIPTAKQTLDDLGMILAGRTQYLLFIVTIKVSAADFRAVYKDTLLADGRNTIFFYNCNILEKERNFLRSKLMSTAKKNDNRYLVFDVGGARRLFDELSEHYPNYDKYPKDDESWWDLDDEPVAKR